MDWRKSANALAAGFGLAGGLSLAATALLYLLLPDSFDTNGRTENPGLLWFATGYALAFGIAGFYLTARLAPDRPLAHALWLGVIGLVACALGSILFWETAPAWYHWINLAQVLPAAWLGGWLRVRQLPS